MIIFGNLYPSSSTPREHLDITSRPSDGATLLTLTRHQADPCISNDQMPSRWQASVAAQSRESIKALAASPAYQRATKTIEHLNHNWVRIEHDYALLIYSDTLTYGFNCQKDRGFPNEKLYALNSHSPYFSERECATQLSKHNLTFDDLRNMPGADPEKIDIIVRHRMAIHQQIQSSGKTPIDYFKTLLALPVQSIESTLGKSAHARNNLQ